MSEFFKSEMVKGDLQEMAELQMYCARAALALPVLPKEKVLEYFDILETFIEKQKIFYTRLSLSDDPEAMELANSMRQSALQATVQAAGMFKNFGYPMIEVNENTSINHIFDTMVDRLREVRKKLEEQGKT